VQYTAIRYSDRLAQAGIARFVGRVGDSYDTALAVCLNALNKKKVITTRPAGNDATEVTLAAVAGLQ
jgi:putative transposase